ncbi:MAG: tetratricopeptide repeat protein [Sphingobacteriaceae bacterium]|nr:tetratricopeptide repeat protein [Sphingobacteriaceae bacterium]
MKKKHFFISIILLFIFEGSFAQQSSLLVVNKHFLLGKELFDNGKFAAASFQFQQVEKESSSLNLEELKQCSLIKESSQLFFILSNFELGNTDAFEALLSFTEKHPLHSNIELAYFYLGKYYFLNKNHEKVLEYFDKVAIASLNNEQQVEMLFKLGYSNFELENYGKAEVLFDRVKSQESIYKLDATYYYAYINYLNKEYKIALFNFEKLKGSPTYESSYPYYIISMYYLDERFEDVIDYAIPIISATKQKFEPEILSLIASSYFAKSDYKNAKQYFDDYYLKDKNKEKANIFVYQYGYSLFYLKEYLASVSVLQMLSNEDIYYQNGMYTLAKAYLELNNKEKARSAFYSANRLSYDNKVQEDAWLNYSRLSYELGFNTQALESIQSFLLQFPNSKLKMEFKTLQGEVLLTGKNYQAAIEVLETIQNKSSEAKEAYQRATYFRGLQFYNERAFPNAISMFLKSSNYSEDKELVALNLYWTAEAMYELRKFKESIKTFEQFLSNLESKKTEVYNYANYGLGYAYFENENYSKAATYFEKFLKEGDKDIKTINDATLRVADSYFILKKYDQAIENYKQIISAKVGGQDYALFQKGVIEGLQNNNTNKLESLQYLLQNFPTSNYADDAGFEIAYTYFNTGELDRSKSDLIALIEKYPRSSYVPKAMITIGLVQYNQNQDDAALETFKKVINDYPVTEEAKQALESVKNIYIDKGDSEGFLTYANSTSIGNLSTTEQESLTYQAANNLYLKGESQATIDAINAYFDKFKKSLHEKDARFIRAESYVKINKPNEAIADYEFILNDWTSEFTERSLVRISKIFLNQKKHNEAIVYLKRLETTADYKIHYAFAINNLVTSYSALSMPDEMMKYGLLIKNFEKSSEEEKTSSNLYIGRAFYLKGDTTSAIKSFSEVVSKTKTEAAAEAKFYLAKIQYEKGLHKESQKTCFDLINNMPSYDYWVAKSFILLSDNYFVLKDILQAKSTLQSIIDNYTANDDILSTAREKLEIINKI